MSSHTPPSRVALLLLAFVWMPASPCHAEPRPPGESHYTLMLEPFAEHSGENAIDLTHPPDGSGRIFVSTQSGQVFGFDPQGRPLGVFLDIATARPDFTRTKGSFNGLMYIAFHPDYAKHDTPGFGKLYTGHQVRVEATEPDFNSKDFGGLGDSDVRFVIAEWQVDPDNPDRIAPASYRQVMLIHFHTYSENPHGLGELTFNPYAKPGNADYGKLYIAVGDAHNGNYNKPTHLARTQQPDNPYAKILRIDPLRAGDMTYTVPEDNPFGTEVYALGLRDAQSFSFAKDLDGNPVIVAFDIGANLVEEISVIRPGGNYGWDRYEGTLTFNGNRELNGEAALPIAQYGRVYPTSPGADPVGGSAAIIGGLVVSDPDAPSFQGQILFGDLPRGALMHVNYHHALQAEQKGQQSTPYVMTVQLGKKTGSFADVLGAKRGDTRFGYDEMGHVYIVSKQTGTIFKTGLIYTGLPVASSPSIERDKEATDWAMLAIAGVTAFLIIQFTVVWRSAKRRQA